jgi:integrase
MAVEKRGDAWGVRLQIGGQEVRRSLGPGSTKAHALDLEAKIRRDGINGQLGHPAARPLDDALLRWLEGDSTVHKDRTGDIQRVRMWRPFTAGQSLHDAVAVAGRATDAWLAAGLTPATINRRIALLRRVCRLAHSRWNWLKDDLSRKLVALPGEKSRRVFLSRAQVMILVHAAPKALGDAILLSAYTGLRRGELMRLKPADAVDGCVIVRVAKSGKPRTVPVARQALPILTRLPIPLTLNQLDTQFRAVRKTTGLDHITFHDLRHTYGSWLAESGASGTVIRDVMGHSNLSVTSRYLHSVPAHVRAAVRRLK